MSGDVILSGYELQYFRTVYEGHRGKLPRTTRFGEALSRPVWHSWRMKMRMWPIR